MGRSMMQGQAVRHVLAGCKKHTLGERYVYQYWRVKQFAQPLIHSLPNIEKRPLSPIIPAYLASARRDKRARDPMLL